MACYNNGDFQKYLEENMDALGLPSPTTWFDYTTDGLAVSGVSSELARRFGAGATLRELARSTYKSEKIGLVAGLLFIGYVGAVVGSAAVATGRSLG